MLDGYMASQLYLQGGWMEDLLLNYPNVAKCTIHWVLGMPTTIGTQKAGCSRIVQRLFAGCIVIFDDEKSYQLFNFNFKKTFTKKTDLAWHPGIFNDGTDFCVFCGCLTSQKFGGRNNETDDETDVFCVIFSGGGMNLAKPRRDPLKTPF